MSVGAADAQDWTAGAIALTIPSVPPGTRCSTIAEQFKTSPEKPAIPVMEGERLLGLVDRGRFLMQFASQFGRELYEKKPVVALMDPHPLVVDHTLDVSDLSARVTAERPEALQVGFVVAGPGPLIRIGTGLALMRAVASRMTQTLATLQTAQEDLVQAERLASLGGLVAGVAHEINTPVGTALTAVTALREQLDGFRSLHASGRLTRSELERFLAGVDLGTDFVFANVRRAAELVASFKQVAVDRTSEQERQFHLVAYLQDVLNSLRPRLRRTPHTVELVGPEELEIVSYPGALSQILTNFITNALMHAFEEDTKGHIRIEVRSPSEPERHGEVELSVSDDGVGINPALIKRVFEPFVTSRRGSGGTGLGLHIVYNLVTARLGGRISVESTPGQGTRFVIRFPTGLAVGAPMTDAVNAAAAATNSISAKQTSSAA
ncbi:MAG: hypothetical protein EAZ99_05195 [Alphaproteobacteria bacterium]|nr:MAG: hypothetical protein EAZ99_05195 [Alphaproteobacteria bacterium]